MFCSLQSSKAVGQAIKQREYKGHTYAAYVTSSAILNLVNMYFDSFENLTSGCHGYAFVGVMSKSTNLAKITLLVSMETW